MNEEKEMTAEEQKLKKMDWSFGVTLDLVLYEVKKIVGRDLTDEEKEKLGSSLKMYFMFTLMMMREI